MTKPRYSTSCAAGSQVRRDAFPPAAWSPEDYAWNVNFNNGNANYWNRNNNARVRAVRVASEYRGVTFRALFDAWQSARRRKVPSQNQLAFEANWIDELLRLEQLIKSGAWRPRPSTCFIAARPKAREIHAPDFADRIMHHWLVPQLEAIFEPKFIAQSYSNRIGKGTHAAVDQLKSYVRQVASGQGGGWYLQLDIANFFNAIHRPTLYALLKRAMDRADIDVDAQRVAHALLARSPTAAGVVHRSTSAERALVPAHKRLENARAGCGLPIGNLSSQFFANVYLDRLDQFVKHGLKARRYVRYVDDFVLVHRERAQLEAWLAAIRMFLRDELRLELKADIKLRPLHAGIDFLGYVVFPTHTLIRRRVVRHAFHALKAAPRRTADQRARRRAVLASYLGHFDQANAAALRQRLLAAYGEPLSLFHRHRDFASRNL